MSIYKCQVKNCRYPQSHTTSGHKCGNCNSFGHGLLECGDNNLINRLTRFKHDTIEPNDYCSVVRCPYPHNHNTIAHHCYKCGKRHQESECIIQALSHYRSLGQNSHQFNGIESILENEQNIYIIKYAGMGCQYYIRKKENNIDVLFMHQDSWGQYGSDTNDEPILNKFLEGLNQYQIQIEFDDDSQERIIKCPICRTENNISEIKNLKGVSEKCCICYENNVDKYFSKCEHACVCAECLDKL